MTSNERRALRAALIVLGFKRVDYTEDILAVGDYQEVWSKGENQVTIAWGARTPEDPTEEQIDESPV